MDITWITHTHVFHGVVSGIGAAAMVDYHAFKNFKSVHEAATYDWGTAVFRWVQGAVVGGVTAGVLGGSFPDTAGFGV